MSTVSAFPRMVKKLDLLEFTHGCGLSQGKARNPRRPPRPLRRRRLAKDGSTPSAESKGAKILELIGWKKGANLGGGFSCGGNAPAQKRPREPRIVRAHIVRALPGIQARA